MDKLIKVLDEVNVDVVSLTDEQLQKKFEEIRVCGVVGSMLVDKLRPVGRYSDLAEMGVDPLPFTCRSPIDISDMHLGIQRWEAEGKLYYRKRDQVTNTWGPWKLVE